MHPEKERDKVPVELLLVRAMCHMLDTPQSDRSESACEVGLKGREVGSAVGTCLSLLLQNCRGQCYEGTSTMRSAWNVVVELILAQERVIYFALLWTCSQLGSSRLCKKLESEEDALEVSYKVSKLVKSTPKRMTFLTDWKRHSHQMVLGFVHFVPLGGLWEQIHRSQWLTIMAACKHCETSQRVEVLIPQ